MFYIFFQIKNYAVWLVSLKLGCSHRSARASSRLCFVNQHQQSAVQPTYASLQPLQPWRSIFPNTVHQSFSDAQLTGSSYLNLSFSNSPSTTASSDQVGSKKPVTVPSTRFSKMEVNLLLAIWEEQFTAFQDKKRVQHDDWEELASEYNEQAKRHGFQDRTATQIENKIRNLKDSYKKAKDESTRSGAGNNKENNFPYYEIFNRLFSGIEAFSPKHILDPGKKTDDSVREIDASASSNAREKDNRTPFNSVENLLNSDPGTSGKTDDQCSKSKSDKKPSGKRPSVNSDDVSPSSKPKKGKSKAELAKEEDDNFMKFFQESRERDQEMCEKIIDLTEKADKRSSDLRMKLMETLAKLVQK